MSPQPLKKKLPHPEINKYLQTKLPQEGQQDIGEYPYDEKFRHTLKMHRTHLVVEMQWLVSKATTTTP